MHPALNLDLSRELSLWPPRSANLRPKAKALSTSYHFLPVVAM